MGGEKIQDRTYSSYAPEAAGLQKRAPGACLQIGSLLMLAASLASGSSAFLLPMETVFQYEIPVWHPLAVHFPLALILAAAAAAVVWSFRGTSFWRRCALLLFTLGMAGGIAAYKTGEAMEEQAEGTPIVEELVELHEDMALYALIATGVTLVALAGVSVWLERRTTLERNLKDPLAARLVLAVAAVIAAALVAWTGHIGATMVWGVTP